MRRMIRSYPRETCPCHTIHPRSTESDTFRPTGHGKITGQVPGARELRAPIITVAPSAKAQVTSLAFNPCLVIISFRMTGISR